jgi:hypothetical protein
MQTPGLLKVVKQNQWGDVQYKEARVNEVSEGDVLDPMEGVVCWDELDDSVPWCIKYPSMRCILAVSSVVQGCVVYHRGDKTYLMSPRAHLYLTTAPSQSESVIITFNGFNPDAGFTEAPYVTFFLLFKPLECKFWDNLTLTTTLVKSGKTLFELLKEKLGIPIKRTWLTNQGTFQVHRKYNTVFEFRPFGVETVYHLNLREHQVKNVFKFTGINKPDFPVFKKSLFASHKQDGSKVLFLKGDDLFVKERMKDTLSPLTQEVMLRMYAKTLGPLHFIKSFNLIPFYHYRNNELTLIRDDSKKQGQEEKKQE